MADLLSVADLEAAKKHDTFHSEVITGKVGGLAGGANIPTATNAVTGQVQRVLPEVLDSYGFNIAEFTFAEGGILDGKNILIPNSPANSSYYKYIGASAFPLTVNAGTNPVGNADWQSIITTDARFLNNSKITVGSIKSLSVPTVTGQSFSVTGFYAGTTVGGGDFIYDASRDKADHNGGTVIAPEAVAAWDGSQVNLSSLLNWTGAGAGCFARVNYTSLYISYFGGVKGGLDNKLAFDKAALVAVADGNVFEFDDLYAVSGVELNGDHDGLILRGTSSPNEVSDSGDLCGLKPFSDNQDYVISVGQDASTWQGGAFEDFCIYGDNLSVNTAGLVVKRWSQGYGKNLAVRNFKGAGVYFNKGEDLQFDNIRVVKCGTVAGQEGGVVFGPTVDVSNNIIRFIGGRVEWIDGPMVSVSSDTNSAVSHVWFYGTKFEVAERDGYGSTRALNAVFDLSKANVFWRCANINFVDCWVSQAQQAKSVFKIGKSNGITSRGLNMSSPTGGAINLVESVGIVDAKALSIRDSKVINTGGDYTNFNVTTDVSSSSPMDIEYPEIYGGNGFSLSNQINKNIITAAQAGVDGRLERDAESINVSKQVMSLAGQGNSTVCRLSSTRYGTEVKGFDPLKFNQLINVKFRAKKTGTTGLVSLYAGSDYLDRADLTDAWEWYQVGGTLRGRAGQVSLNTNPTSSIDAKIFIDAIEVSYGTTHKIISFGDISGQYDSGDVVELSTAPASGLPYSKLCTVGGNPATFVNMFVIP
ncbi:tailspike [Shewanella sp. phage 3/49]|uniref:tail spike protein n=1 Tax=Shewanella sp. phage 3/49 TaxID=1458863 RepID=UPI0004F6A55B|nr:tail spike protein [Shewanella sp. phage 3/49]AHK11834.1 tailspike [Shewanella sp. phage 3/49]